MIIVVAQSKGGSSKSTLCINLQYYLRKYNPTLVNLDIQNSIVDLNQIRSKRAKPFKLTQIKNVDQLESIYENNTKDSLYIVDTIGTDTELTRTALLMSDLIISPVSDKTIDILGLMNFQNVLAELSKKTDDTLKSHVVISNVLPAIKRFDDLRDLIITSKHFNLFHAIIRQRSDVANAVGYGLAAGEYAPSSKADNEFKLFAREIEKLL